MRKWIGGALGRRQQLVNNLSRGRFADGAIAVPDPALRERVLAPAGARLGVEFVKRDGSLLRRQLGQDRKSTRLNSSHGYISYAVFCLKKKKTNTTDSTTLSC